MNFRFETIGSNTFLVRFHCITVITKTLAVIHLMIVGRQEILI